MVKTTATGTIWVQNQSKGIGPGGLKDGQGNPVLPPDPNYVDSKLPVFALIGTISQNAPSVPLLTGSAFLVGDVVWQTGTTGHPAAQLQLDTNAGTLTITEGGTKIWPA